MRRAIKNQATEILLQDLLYPRDREAITGYVLTEQKKFCAYTDDYITATMARDIEHFNPTLKGAGNDGYNNWFVVSHRYNMKKKRKWEDYQPILHPAADDFENRIQYFDGDYVFRQDDIEAKHLNDFLNLDDEELREERISYIEAIRVLVNNFGVGWLTNYLRNHTNLIRFPRAIFEEFGINIFDLV